MILQYTYGQMIGSFVENADVLDKNADILLFYNDIVCTDDRLAKKVLERTDLKSLLKGMTKRKWRK